MRILGVNIPDNKAVSIALTYIYGIGHPSAARICSECNIDKNVRLRTLNQDEINSIIALIKKDFIVEGDLRKNISMAIKHLTDIKCYRGIRHRKGLPVRGQRTNTNARTRKGKAKMPVAGKKKA